MLENAVSIITALASLLVALWRFGESELGRALIQSIKGGGVLQARAILEKQALCIVTKYQQTFVKGLKEAFADGELTEEEIKVELGKIKERARQDFADSASGSAIGEALTALGINNTDKLIDQLIEGAVHKLRGLTAGTTVTASTSSTSEVTLEVKEE